MGYDPTEHTDAIRDKQEEDRKISKSRDLEKSLIGHEEYLLQEVIKKLSLDGENSSKKIKQTIKHVIDTDTHQYVQNAEVYKEFQNTPIILGDIIDFYVEILKNKIIR